MKPLALTVALAVSSPSFAAAPGYGSPEIVESAFTKRSTPLATAAECKAGVDPKVQTCIKDIEGTIRLWDGLAVLTPYKRPETAMDGAVYEYCDGSRKFVGTLNGVTRVMPITDKTTRPHGEQTKKDGELTWEEQVETLVWSGSVGFPICSSADAERAIRENPAATAEQKQLWEELGGIPATALYCMDAAIYEHKARNVASIYWNPFMFDDSGVIHIGLDVNGDGMVTLEDKQLYLDGYRRGDEEITVTTPLH